MRIQLNKRRFLLAASFLWLTLPASIPPERVVVSLPGDEVSRARVNSNITTPVLPSAEPGADSVIIPLKRAGRLFLFDATIDGESGNIIFDSGSKNILLNSTYFRKYLKTSKVTSGGITGDVSQAGEITVGQITFAGMEYKNVTVHLAGLGHIENSKGVKILGLAGFNFFRKHEIMIDPLNNQMKLFRIGKNGNRADGRTTAFMPDVLQKIEGSGNVLFLKGTIGGKLLNFCFDTAAETNVISSNSGKQVLNTLAVTRRTTLKGAGTVTSEVLFGKMNDFTIGGHRITGMETVISNLNTLNEAYNTHIDGILGCSFLDHGLVYVNFEKSQIGIRFLKGEEK